MNKEKRKEIMVEAPYFIQIEDFEGDIMEVCKRIKNFPNKFKKLYPLNEDFKNSHRFSIRSERDYDYDSGSSLEYFLQYFRWETDEEMNKRIEESKKRNLSEKESAAKRKDAQIQREKTLYENLKKKFEKV